MHEGLDKCSSLLSAMMKPSAMNQVEPKRKKKEVQIICTKKKKTLAKDRKPLYNKRLPTSTPVHRRKETLQSSNVVKDSILSKHDVLESNTIDELISKHDQLTQYLRVDEYKKPPKSQLTKKDGNSFIQHIGNVNKNGTKKLDNTVHSLSLCQVPEKLYETEDVKQSSVLEHLVKSITEKLSVNEQPARIGLSNSGSYVEAERSRCLSGRISDGRKYYRNCPAEKFTQNTVITSQKSSDLGIPPLSRQTREVFKTQVQDVKDGLEKSSSRVKFGNVSVDGRHINIQITTLTYLLKDLYAMLGEKRNLELDHLLTEIDHIVGLLPFMLNESHTGVHQDYGVVQFLQTENDELKRNLQLATKTLQTVNELKSVADSKNVLVSENGRLYVKELESKLLIEEQTKESLSNQIAEVAKVTDGLRKENQNLSQSLSDKEANFRQEKQKWLKSQASTKEELCEAKEEMKALLVNLQTMEKEKKIWDISLQQRDDEIARLTTLNRDLQNSISRLLEDIHWQRQKHHHNGRRQISTDNNKERKKPLKGPNSVGSHLHEHRSVITVQDEYDCKDVITSNQYAKVDLQKSSHDIIPSSNQSENVYSSSSLTNSSVSTLKTFDNIDFQNDLLHLDTKLDVVQHEIDRKETDME